MNENQTYEKMAIISIISLALMFFAEIYIVILENFEKLSDIGSITSFQFNLIFTKTLHFIVCNFFYISICPKK